MLIFFLIYYEGKVIIEGICCKRNGDGTGENKKGEPSSESAFSKNQKLIT